MQAILRHILACRGRANFDGYGTLSVRYFVLLRACSTQRIVVQRRTLCVGQNSLHLRDHYFFRSLSCFADRRSALSARYSMLSSSQ